MNEYLRRHHSMLLAGLTSPAWTFFRQWLKNPRAMASLSPSGHQLACRMVAQVPAQAQRVIELGAGTGVFTRALIEHGIAPQDLLVVELNEALYSFLHKHFPEANVVHGDACDLADIAERLSFAGTNGVDAVVSGLGFLAMPRDLQRKILQAIFSVLAPGCPLIQFTYAPTSPLPRDLLDELGLSVRRAGTVWVNAPPAGVYVYTRNRSMPIPATRVNGAH